MHPLHPLTHCPKCGCGVRHRYRPQPPLQQMRLHALFQRSGCGGCNNPRQRKPHTPHHQSFRPCQGYAGFARWICRPQRDCRRCPAPRSEGGARHRNTQCPLSLFTTEHISFRRTGCAHPRPDFHRRHCAKRRDKCGRRCGRRTILSTFCRYYQQDRFAIHKKRTDTIINPATRRIYQYKSI